MGQKSQKPIPALHAAPFPDGFCIADPPGWEPFGLLHPIEDHLQAGRPSSLVVGSLPRTSMRGSDCGDALGCEGAFGTFGTFQKYKRIKIDHYFDPEALAKREIPIPYGYEEFQEDWETLRLMSKR